MSINGVFIVIDIVLFFVFVKYLIDVQHLTIRLAKSKEIATQRTEKDDRYEFIRGLH